ncbi:hypothetical protein E3T43_18110 [Cryobacterium sp. Hh7]|uniref:hypothetical protein n=1 Tax=Cryobacterium sp. Hh7 TaxID=1259159 RepID=UPI00106BFC85|nr:hypothetical protein [Cryobacterium sp. Hh7]TFD50437.1 hypothetical protein E3T43_18110 [Cryobacterium sp. Hh7]
MSSPINQRTYTVKSAAARTGRTIRTIRQWIRDGMKCRNVNGMIIIDHVDLMQRYRTNIMARGHRDTLELE